jgi:glycine/D-amino acid oxidase-like deaminating enzyme
MMRVDAVVIGGGFFGCQIALELRRIGVKRVILYERESGLILRASYANQARIHNGYHYPRSLSTALRSRKNFERFIDEYRSAISFDAENVYAIAGNSRVNATQFFSFCSKIGAPCHEAPQRLRRLFDEDLIEQVFLTREFTFNAVALAARCMSDLDAANVDVRLSTAAHIERIDKSYVTVSTAQETIESGLVLNCTYSDIDAVGISLHSQLKREVAELLLIQPPQEVAAVGVTVMDGPYFSMMPFPAENLHSLSHVRYTPHEVWIGPNRPSTYSSRSNAAFMIRDAMRYLPCLKNAVPVRSIFEIKTTLVQNEDDDGRPILMEVSPEGPRVVTIMGSKIDNIYDALDAIRSHRWEN